MNARDVIEIVKESRLWDALTAREKQDAIKHALDMSFGSWKRAVKSVEEIEREIQPMARVGEVSQ